MSGDLKNPARAIPLGTALAVGLSFVVYIGAAIIFAGTVPRDTLLSDYGAMKSVSAFAPLIDAGIIAALGGIASLKRG